MIGGTEALPHVDRIDAHEDRHGRRNHDASGTSSKGRSVLSVQEVNAVRAGGQVLRQADGATVRVLANEGRFNVMVEGDRGIITTFKNLSQKSIDKLAQNYGWK